MQTKLLFENATPVDYEETFDWGKMSGEQQAMCIASYTEAYKLNGLKTSHDTVRRIFQLGNPKMIIGMANEKPYVNISRESVEVMKLLFTQYIEEK